MSKTGKKGKGGRPPGERLIAGRLRQAVKDAGMRFNEFGHLIHREYDLPQAGRWFNDICAGRRGVDPQTLQLISRVLGVRESWLVDQEEQFRTEKDLERHMVEQKIGQKNRRRFAMQHTLSDIEKSPIYGLLSGRLTNYGILSDSDGNQWALLFLGDETKVTGEKAYMLFADDLKMIEAACADLCCSLIRNNSIPDQQQQTLILPRIVDAAAGITPAMHDSLHDLPQAPEAEGGLQKQKQDAGKTWHPTERE